MPLVWESADGQQRFELGLVGYEFPEGAEDERDANWLIVRVAARDGASAWAAEDPALLTWEVEQLARWLERLARGRLDHPWRGFSEPNLEFRADPLPDAGGAAGEAAGGAGRPGAGRAAAGQAEHAADATGAAAGARVRVYFELELRPPERRSRAVGKRDVYLTFALTPEQLRASARALREELQAFPVREPGAGE